MRHKRLGLLALALAAVIGGALDSDEAPRAQTCLEVEVCDGIDNDCDGQADEGVSRTFYRDADGDSFGTADPAIQPQRGCTPPAGYVENSTDCDDGIAARNPGAPEACDGIDNDCDGQADEGVSRTFHRDADGDGFGTPDPTIAPQRACTPPAGYVENGTDCDDGAASRNPGAPEICDSIDNDCDAQVDEGLLVAMYVDYDRDGFGALGTSSVQRCPATAGFSPHSNDCDDKNPALGPGSMRCTSRTSVAICNPAGWEVFACSCSLQPNGTGLCVGR